MKKKIMDCSTGKEYLIDIELTEEQKAAYNPVEIEEIDPNEVRIQQLEEALAVLLLKEVDVSA